MLTEHHLIPRARHGKRTARERYTPEEMKSRTVMLCRPCHKMIHAVLSTKALAAEYPTLARLRKHPEIAKYVAWARRHPSATNVRVRRPRNRR